MRSQCQPVHTCIHASHGYGHAEVRGDAVSATGLLCEEALCCHAHDRLTTWMHGCMHVQGVYSHNEDARTVKNMRPDVLSTGWHSLARASSSSVAQRWASRTPVSSTVTSHTQGMSTCVGAHEETHITHLTLWQYTQVYSCSCKTKTCRRLYERPMNV